MAWGTGLTFSWLAPLRDAVFGRLWVRLLAITVTPVLITVISVALLANYVAIGQFENFLAQDTQQRDDRLQQVLVHYYQEQGSWASVDANVQRMAALVGERLVLTDAGGKVVADSGGQLVGQQEGRNWRRPIPLQNGDSHLGTLYINPLLPGRASSLRTQAFLSGVNRSLEIGLALAVVAALILTVLFSYRLRRQLAQIIRVAGQIGRGNFSLRVPTPEEGDLADMGMAINHMAEDLERLLQARQQMVADVAHELRNPLQNINGYLEAIRDGVLPADERTIAILSSETAVLRRLVDDLQELSLADTGRLAVELKPIQVQDQMAAIIDSMRPRAEERGVALNGPAELNLPLIQADARRVRQVLANLVQNALAVTPRGGQVTITAQPLPGFVEMRVTDTGTGIAQEDQELIFERFFRVDPARSRSTGGAGLGLTIAREFVHAMNGQIGVRSEPGKGAEFWVRLPVAPVARQPRKAQPRTPRRRVPIPAA
jgi:two-component system sensor histidine kinase BaeS